MRFCWKNTYAWKHIQLFGAETAYGSYGNNSFVDCKVISLHRIVVYDVCMLITLNFVNTTLYCYLIYFLINLIYP